MIKLLRKKIRALRHRHGYTGLSPRKIRKLRMEDEFIQLASRGDAVDKFSDKLYTTYKSVQYLEKNSIPGDFVECGVYKGRHISMMALTLKTLGSQERNLYLYDTFKGMTKPGVEDIRTSRVGTGVDPIKDWEEANTEEGNLIRYAGLDEVRNYVYATGYPAERFHFVPGDIRETVPNAMHSQIALLRLDTDWYELTKHELEHMYDQVVPGGIVIIDDYGSHVGARRAVDEFFDTRGSWPMLFRTSKNERSMIKTV